MRYAIGKNKSGHQRLGVCCCDGQKTKKGWPDKPCPACANHGFYGSDISQLCRRHKKALKKRRKDPKNVEPIVD